MNRARAVSRVSTLNSARDSAAGSTSGVARAPPSSAVQSLQSQLYVLFEHAVGYALFKVKEFEEVGMALPQVEKSVLDFNKFKSLVHLIAFFPFRTAVNALENMNCVTEGVVHDDLQTFLETNVPKSTKKSKVILGVGDSKLGMTVQESLGMSCQHTGVVPEVIRGVRLHFYKLVKGLTAVSSSKAQLGLGHSYSRSKVKFNVNRIDNMIIQSIALLDQLDKDINTFAMRVREWYSYHFPELVKIVPDNYTYAKTASLIKNRKDLNEDSLEALEEVVMDSAKAQAIIDAARASMGMDISPVDLINIEMFASRVISLVEYRKELMEYLKTKMHGIAPNLATLIGETAQAAVAALKKQKRKEKKKKKKEREAMENSTMDTTVDAEEEEESPPKKKKKKHAAVEDADEAVEPSCNGDADEEVKKPKKKKKKSKGE
ncbi:hypothetical protein HPB52_003313 [Rhipicephalus sanguineus]|uniref:Nucleolar protein 56 n=1 Tax=Rhipicephalus sanguineus TaxID=34632 RepID=A0A9D4QGM9_RHISA|nr:hypothetical protein HPB52_003313 [Rhipicephalus sanguineus]